MSVHRLYDVPAFEGQDDYLPDAALAAIDERIVGQLPSGGFDMPHCNATTKGVTATVHFAGGSPLTNLDTFEAILRSATVIRSLHANLVAARAALAAGGGS